MFIFRHVLIAESQIEPVAKRARTTVKEQYRPTSSSNRK